MDPDQTALSEPADMDLVLLKKGIILGKLTIRLSCMYRNFHNKGNLVHEILILFP